MADDALSVTCSVADQSFARTKSLGILNLSLGLAGALARRRDLEPFHVLSNSSLASWHDRLGRSVHVVDRPLRSRADRMLWDQWGVYRAAERLGTRWLLLPKGFGSIVRRPRVNVAAYVHDAIGEFYRRRYPRAVSRGESAYFHRSLLASLRDSRVIFTNTEFTRREVLALAARHGVRMGGPVIVAGIGLAERPLPPVRERRGVVALASPLPHKRTDLAVRYLSAWMTSRRERHDVHWVGTFPADVDRPGFEDWHYHGRMDEDEYRSLLDRSRALVYFSEYEGFGMPPAEALMQGVVPVYSALPATMEVMQGAGAPFPNDDCDAFLAAMAAAFGADPGVIERTAASVAARFRWDDVAGRVVAGLRQAVDAGDSTERA